MSPLLSPFGGGWGFEARGARCQCAACVPCFFSRRHRRARARPSGAKIIRVGGATETHGGHAEEARFAQSEQTTLTLREMDARYKDADPGCIYRWCGVWNSHVAWLRARAELAIPGTLAGEHAKGEGNEANLYRALEQCDVFYRQPMWQQQAETPDTLGAQLRLPPRWTRALREVRRSSCQSSICGRPRPPTPGRRLERDVSHLEGTPGCPGSPGPRQAQSDTAEKAGDAKLLRLLLGEQERGICPG